MHVVHESSKNNSCNLDLVSLPSSAVSVLLVVEQGLALGLFELRGLARLGLVDVGLDVACVAVVAFAGAELKPSEGLDGLYAAKLVADGVSTAEHCLVVQVVYDG
jgi:hypothetical protein